MLAAMAHKHMENEKTNYHEVEAYSKVKMATRKQGV